MFTLFFTGVHKYFKPDLIFLRDPFFTISIYTSYEKIYYFFYNVFTFISDVKYRIGLR